MENVSDRKIYLRIFIGVVSALTVYLLLISILIYYESRNEASNIQAFGDAVWYSIVTLTTVGYGDYYPVSPLGKVIGFVFLIFSMGLYGLFIGKITSIMSTIKENKRLGLNGTKMENHAVIIGWNQFGKTVADQLVQAGRNVAIITNRKNEVDLIRENYTPSEAFVLFSDFNNEDMLTRSNIDRSSTVFINLQDDTEKLVYILNLKKHFKDLNYIVLLENANLKSTFISAGVKYAVSKNEISSRLIASYIFEPDVARFTEEIISYADTPEEYDVKQFRVVSHNPYIGHSYDELFFEVKKKFNAILIGITKHESGKTVLHKNPKGDIRIAEGDYLVMIMNSENLDALKAHLHTDEGY